MEGYIIFSMWMTSLIYPVVVCWAWGGPRSALGTGVGSADVAVCRSGFHGDSWCRVWLFRAALLREGRGSAGAFEVAGSRSAASRTLPGVALCT